MKKIANVKLAGLAGAAIALAGVTPATADRCGGSLSIDEATTLAEVARSCNVNLSALYEANPGVDPRNVRPGAILAMPDELSPISSYTPSSKEIVASKSPDANYIRPVTDDHGMPGGYPDQAIRDYDARVSTRVRVREAQLASTDPVWLREATGGGARSYAADRRSFQQRSAARIHNAGVPTFAAPRNGPRVNTSATAAGSPELISCAVLRNEKGGELRKVRKIISTPTNTFVEVAPIAGGGFDCTLVDGASASATDPNVPAAHYGVPAKATSFTAPSRKYRLPDYNTINPGAAKAPTKISLSGDVVGEENGCLLLEADEGGLWALAAAPGAQSLMGKHVTAWGVSSLSGACGASPTLIVSHAVFAEPWQ